MEYCNLCKVKISTKTDICPLCHKKVRIDSNAENTYPDYKPLKNKYTKTVAIISLIAPLLIIFALLLNIFIFKSSYWSAIAIIGIIYFWLLGLLTFNRKVHIQLKLIANAITIPVVLIIINVFASSDLVIKRVTWAISYTMPLIIFSFILFINFIMIRTKQNLKEYLLYQLALCIIGFVPLIIILLEVAEPLFPSLMTAFYSYGTIIYLMFSGKNIIKEEFKKKFHL